MISIQVKQLTKRFGDVVALDRLDLTIKPGELFFLLGPSGCGKTTLLRSLAGFCVPDQGQIFFGGDDVTQLAPHKRNTGMMFQGYALWPHLTVAENVAFGLEERHLPAPEIKSRVAAALAAVHLDAQATRKPNELSGGQQQRVALARALVVRPRCLLLDEPLAALDLKIRQHMLIEMRRTHAQTGATFVYVTHDQDEALILSDRIVLMDRGRIVQIDEPHRMYENPKSLFAAKFLGETNLFEAKPSTLSHAKTASGVEFGAKYNYAGAATSKLIVSLRPECIRFTPSEKYNRSMRGTVVNEVFMGSRSVLSVQLVDGQIVKVQQQRGVDAPPVNPQQLIDIYWSDSDVSIFSAS